MLKQVEVILDLAAFDGFTELETENSPNGLTIIQMVKYVNKQAVKWLEIVCGRDQYNITQGVNYVGNYLTNLNEIFRLQNKLNDVQWVRFIELLDQVIEIDYLTQTKNPVKLKPICGNVNASCYQRARALHLLSIEIQDNDPKNQT